MISSACLVLPCLASGVHVYRNAFHSNGSNDLIWLLDLIVLCNATFLPSCMIAYAMRAWVYLQCILQDNCSVCALFLISSETIVQHQQQFTNKLQTIISFNFCLVFLRVFSHSLCCCCCYCSMIKCLAKMQLCLRIDYARRFIYLLNFISSNGQRVPSNNNFQSSFSIWWQNFNFLLLISCGACVRIFFCKHSICSLVLTNAT